MWFSDRVNITNSIGPHKGQKAHCFVQHSWMIVSIDDYDILIIK